MFSTDLKPDSVAGNETGQRQLNGPQTTGREYRNLSNPEYKIRVENNIHATVRDGTVLMADVMRPDADDKFPALLAISCYPREIQNTGAPLGFVEAGASDFWVPRGYAHVIANVRGTGGSGGSYTWLDETERQDVADLVEFVASQPWCDGNVGMIGISYFAMVQLAAAIEKPEHLKAIFPVATTSDLYEAVWHNGILSETFMTSWLGAVAALAGKPDRLFRSSVLGIAKNILRTERVHSKLQHLNGESILSILGKVLRSKYPAHPWNEIWLDVTLRHRFKDEYWRSRDMTEMLEGTTIPTYLGCDWENVPMHLPSTFKVWDAINQTAPTRMGMLGANGLTWPWESLHYEALAWFDHWLKGKDTGIMEGAPIRYYLPGADEFRESDTWPPESVQREFSLNPDGKLATERVDGSSQFMHLGSLSTHKGAPPQPLPTMLRWTSDALTADLDMAGYIELILDASVTATDVHWIVTLHDLSPDGDLYDVTAGWLRGSMRSVDEERSQPGNPVITCADATSIEPGEIVRYRIPLIANARRFKAGHRIALTIACDDTSKEHPAIMGFRHQSLADQTINTIASTSLLLLPIIGESA